MLKFHEKVYINSEGLKILIQLLSETNKNQQQVGIVGLSDHFKKIFRMVGITKLARIFGSVNEALEIIAGSAEDHKSK